MDDTREQERPMYVVFESAGNSCITEITNNTAKAQKWRDNGYEVISTSSTVAATQLFLTPPSLYSRLDDATWADLAQGMEELHANHIIYLSEKTQSGFFDHTPPLDLPAELAIKRLERLRQFPSPANIPVQRELTEIVMAHANDRKVDQTLFTEKSLKADSWNDSIDGMDEEDFQQWESDRNGELALIANANKERETRGQPVPPEDLVKEAQLLHELMEIGSTRHQRLFISTLQASPDETVSFSPTIN